MAKTTKYKKPDYTLPEFDLQKLLDHIQKCVDDAPHGIVWLVVDLFCGAGGVSEGIEQALSACGKKCAVIIAGINHDEVALYSQAVNHPLAYYSTEDIRTANLKRIKELIDICRERFPQCPVIVWASAECTNHSNAKGGMSRDADSRTQPWDLFRYMRVLKPQGLWMENVKEFAEWGPLMEKVVFTKGAKKYTLPEPVDPEKEKAYYDAKISEGWIGSCPLDMKKKKKGKTKGKKLLPPEPLPPIWIPIKRLKGTFYHPWKQKIESFGFHSQQWLLNAADYGVPQSRKRIFPMFMKKGLPIVRPEPTHAKKASNDLFSGLKPYVPIKTCLDFSVEGESIFTPGKIKSPRSFERLYEGLIKHVAGGKSAYMMQRNSGSPVSKVFPVDSPARTVTGTGGNQELVQAYYISKQNSSHNNTQFNKGVSIEEPSPTITTISTNQLVDIHFIGKYNSNNMKDGGASKGTSIQEPSPILTTQDRIMLVKASFISKYGSDEGKDKLNAGHSIEEPSRTITGMNHFSLVDAYLIDVYNGNGQTNSISDTSPTVTAAERLSLMNLQYLIVANHPDQQSEPFVISPHYDNAGNSIHEPSTTITAGRKHHYIINPSHGGHSGSIDNPSGTVIARQDKAPLSLVTVDENGKLFFAIPVFKDDLPIVVKIKEFMALYGIADIKQRMLLVPELLKIQSFPENYYLAGSQTCQKKHIGNAVPPKWGKAIAESMHSGYLTYFLNTYKSAA